MKKLSIAQEKALNNAKIKIDKERNMTLEEYIKNSGVRVCDIFPYEWFKEKYNDAKNGIVTVNSTLPTLRKLESFGLIKILEEDDFRKERVFHKIQVLNY